MGERVPGMSSPMMGEGPADKPVVFAPRIDPGLKEQIDGIRAITGQTVNELGQEALQDWVAKKLGDEDVRNQAMAGIEEEERRIQERKATIAKALGLTTVAKDGGAETSDPKATEPKTDGAKLEGSAGVRGGRGGPKVDNK